MLPSVKEKITTFLPVCTLLLVVTQCTAQNAPRADIYHVHFAKAVPGKAVQLADSLKTQSPSAPFKGHLVVLRHEDGDDWDYVAIEHMGPKATVDAAAPPTPLAVRNLGEWHTDTFALGPSWTEFARAMGLDQAARTANSVYVVGIYRAVPGHREELEKLLAQPLGKTDTIAGRVTLQHLEGAAWHYVAILRYNSWQDFATNESNGLVQTRKNAGPWLQFREHAEYHTDTLTDRIAP